MSEVRFSSVVELLLVVMLGAGRDLIINDRVMMKTQFYLHVVQSCKGSESLYWFDVYLHFLHNFGKLATSGCWPHS